MLPDNQENFYFSEEKNKKTSAASRS